MHCCEYDKILVEDNLMIYTSPKGEVSTQIVNYCPICGWCKKTADLLKERNIKDGI
jgi:hypothetical protein